MKRNNYLKYLQIGAVALAMTFGFSVYAETPREELVHAYHLLQRAGHDYDGHKGKAMTEIQAASHDLGLDVGGADLPGGEAQWKSDAQLKEARRLLREVRNKMERVDRDRITGHLDTAITQLDQALKVK